MSLLALFFQLVKVSTSLSEVEKVRQLSSSLKFLLAVYWFLTWKEPSKDKMLDDLALVKYLALVESQHSTSRRNE